VTRIFKKACSNKGIIGITVADKKNKVKVNKLPMKNNTISELFDCSENKRKKFPIPFKDPRKIFEKE
jgi:hypothetical protein